MEQVRVSADRGRVRRVQRAKLSPSGTDDLTRSLEQTSILGLQRTIGNSATTDLLHGLGPPDLQLAPNVSRETATKAGPAAATAPGLSHREAYDQWFARNYERLSKNEDSLHDSIKAFLLLISRADRVYFYRGIEKETGARLDPAVFSQALDAFVKTIGGKIMGQLLKDPKGLETWKGFLSEFAPYLSDGEKGTEYREGVEDQLLKVYAAAEGKATGKTPKQLQEVADVQVQPIIEHYLTVMEFGATQAAAAWSGLPLPKKGGGSAGIEVAASTADFAKEAAEIILKHGTALAEIVIPELAILKFGLELIGIVQADIEQEEWEEKLQLRSVLEARAKRELYHMYNAIYTQAYEHEDVLALLATSRAIKAGIHPEGPNKTKLKDFVRTEVFGKDFSDNPSLMLDIALRRLEELSTEYAQRLRE